MQTIATCVTQIAGPISQMTSNRRFFSGKAPRPLRLPHITIQCPVYEGSLNSVIDPTAKSVEAAILTYEIQGGSASLFIDDGGMQLISETDAQVRKDYYDEHNNWPVQSVTPKLQMEHYHSFALGSSRRP
jgi:hypothetical protein